MTGTSSDFGKELDSLSDFLSFGIAPALILYFWGFSELERFGWLLVFLLPVAGAIRLARFNIQTQVMDKRYFVGLPIPAGAAASIFPLYFMDADFLEKMRSSSHHVLLAVKTAALVYVVMIAFLMVSTVKYRSFKEFDVRSRRPSSFFFFLVFILVLIIVWRELVLLIFAVAYMVSGPFSFAIEKLRKAGPPKEALEEKLTDE